MSAYLKQITQEIMWLLIVSVIKWFQVQFGINKQVISNENKMHDPVGWE